MRTAAVVTLVLSAVAGVLAPASADNGIPTTWQSNSGTPRLLPSPSFWLSLSLSLSPTDVATLLIYDFLRHVGPAEVQYVEQPFTDDGGVQQVHVSLAPQSSTPGAVVVSFASSTQSDDAGVYYREDGAKEISFVSAKVTSYSHTTNENGGTYTSPYLYHALVEEVSTNCTLRYEPSLQSGQQPAELSRAVRVPPLASAFGGDPNQSMKLALIGDLGQTSNSMQTMDHLVQDEGIAALLVMGDLSYADNLDERWDNWGRLFEPVLDNTPLMALPGNHEIETDAKDGVSFRPYAHRFQNMPNCQNGCGGFDENGWKANMWHSFDLGSAHIIHVSSYHKYEPGSPQYMWLDRDLKAVDRRKTPWVFVNLHAPWYNSNVAHQGEYQSYDVRRVWQPLVCDSRVNIMFAGHVHSYERVLPTCDNTTVNSATGVTHINIGDGGNREGLYDYWLPGENGRAAPVWSAFREGSYGHGVLDIRNATHAYWTWHRNDDGEKMARDTTWVVNQVAVEAAQEGQRGQDGVGQGPTLVNNFFSVHITFLPLLLVLMLAAYSAFVTVVLLRRRRGERDYDRLTELTATDKV